MITVEYGNCVMITVVGRDLVFIEVKRSRHTHLRGNRRDSTYINSNHHRCY